MSAEDNNAIVKRFYAEINLAALDELVVEDYVNHAPAAFPGLAEGREGLTQALKIFWDTTPGYHKIEDMIAEDDKVVTRITAYGKHIGGGPAGERSVRPNPARAWRATTVLLRA